MNQPLRFLTLFFALLILSGCSSYRVVIEPRPDDSRPVMSVVHADTGTTTWDDHVALVEVNGIIQDAPTAGLIGSGPNPVAQFVQDLDAVASDAGAKVLIVRINSRGGTVTASEVVYRELKRFKERTQRPVVILMADVAASGGYYLACAGDHLVAHPTTITGSIGVIMQRWDLSPGMEKLGVRYIPITSGPNKAMGTPFAPMDPAHRELMQNIVDEFYAAFRGVVHENRPDIDDATLDRITDGRVVTGRQALTHGLIDEVGDLYDAFEAAKKLAGLERAQLRRVHRASQPVGSVYGQAPQVNVLSVNVTQPTDDTAVFHYVWDPDVWGAAARP